MVQETGIKAIPMEKKRQKATWLSGKAFHIAVRRREAPVITLDPGIEFHGGSSVLGEQGQRV